MSTNMSNDNNREYQGYDKKAIDIQAEREGAALRKQGKYTQSRYHWIRLQEGYKRSIERKEFRGK